MIGAGAGATTIRGGGPVPITVGTLGDDSPPTVSIAGVKITGGRTSRGIEGEGTSVRSAAACSSRPAPTSDPARA